MNENNESPIDWSRTALGAPESWSPSLRLLAPVVHANPFPHLLFWGPEYVCLYNEGCSSLLGDGHPRVLGQPLREAGPEIWNALRPLIDPPFNGGAATSMQDLELELRRGGLLEEVHFVIACSAVPDESAQSGIGGVLATVHEVTDKVIHERRIESLRQLGDALADAGTERQACVAAAGVLATCPKDVPFAQIYLLDESEPRLAASTGADGHQAAADVLRVTVEQVLTSGKSQVRSGLVGLPPATPGNSAHVTDSVVVVPIRAFGDSRPAGALVGGVSPRLRLDPGYMGFFELIGGQISAAMASIRASTESQQRRENQEALLAQRTALETAARQKDEFLAMLAHELRNPLAPIRNSGELLLRQLPEDAPERAAVHTIERQVTHLTRIVDDLLDVSRITQGRIELRLRPTAVADVITRSLETVDPLIRHKNHQVTVLGDRHLLVNADTERLVQCLSNVLTNAAKYTEAGGEIRIETRGIGDQVRITVTDNGMGMAPELLAKAFDLFVQGERTLDRAQGGLGIGLSLVKKLVELHEGSVDIRSGGAQQGTTFEMRLPSLKAAAVSVPDQAAASSRPRRVLVVDDNEDAAQTLTMILELEGHEVAMAHSGVQALDTVDDFHPEVVLLDIGLPGLDGYEVAACIRSEPRNDLVKLVALTGFGTENDRQRTQDAGFSHHLVKPVDFGDLQRVLNDLRH